MQASTTAIQSWVYRHPYLFFIALALLVVIALQIEPVDPMWRDERGRTPLYLAAEQGDTRKVGSLLKQTGNPDQQDDCRWTPLMRAAQNGHLEVAEMLLAAGADVNAIDKGGYTVLMVAAGGGNPDILRLLLRHGARLDAQDPEFGRTALHRAARENLPGNIRVLLSAGADTRLRDSSGMTALDLALQHGHQSTAELLRAAE